MEAKENTFDAAKDEERELDPTLIYGGLTLIENPS
jgi:hypothetical protein